MRAQDISTSFVERQNLCACRRGDTRDLTNAFSKKIQDHAAAVALHFVHSAVFTKTLPFTAAMEAGVADHIWTVEEVVSLMDSVKGQNVA